MPMCSTTARSSTLGPPRNCAPTKRVSRSSPAPAPKLGPGWKRRLSNENPSPPIGGRGRGPARSAGRVRWACTWTAGVSPACGRDARAPFPHLTPTLSAPGGGEGDEWRMSTLPLKLTVTPLLILLASLAIRRWGEIVGGWFVGLPLTSAPVCFFLALDQGVGFAASASLGSLAGAASEAGFGLAYSLTARRFGWSP